MDSRMLLFIELHALVENKYDFTKDEAGYIALFGELLDDSQLEKKLRLCIPDQVEKAYNSGLKVIRYGIAEYLDIPGYSVKKVDEYLDLSMWFGRMVP